MPKKTKEVSVIDKLKHLLKPETIVEIKTRSYGFHRGFFKKEETCQIKQINDDEITCVNINTGESIKSTVNQIIKIDGMDLHRLARVYK